MLKCILGFRICSAMLDPDFAFQIFFVAPGQKEIAPCLVTRGSYTVSVKHLQHYTLQGDLEIQLLLYWNHGTRSRRLRFSLNRIKIATQVTVHPSLGKNRIKRAGTRHITSHRNCSKDLFVDFSG